MSLSTATPELALASGPRWRRLLSELLPPLAVALVLLPFIISGGHLWPWRPATIDLDVYIYAVRDMLAGKDIYLTRSPGWNLTFIYPPFAAVLMAPLAVGPYTLWQVLWTGAGVAAQQSVIRRCGGPRGWRLGLLGVAVVVGCEPLRTTLGYGQVNTLLMFLVVADLLPRPGARFSADRSWLRGSLVGLATAIKLTPALFAVFAFVSGRKKFAIVAFVAFCLSTAVGAIFQPTQTLDYWTGLAGGNTRAPSGPSYVGNQSVLGAFARLVGTSAPATIVGLAAGLLIAGVAVAAARHWWQRAVTLADRAVAIGLVGLATCLASPLSWTHHYVWILPLAIGLLTGASMPRWLRGVGLFWSLWVSVGLPLAVLPYGGGREAGYAWWQDLIGSLGPITGAVLVVGLGASMLAGRGLPSTGRSKVAT